MYKYCQLPPRYRFKKRLLFSSRICYLLYLRCGSKAFLNATHQVQNSIGRRPLRQEVRDTRGVNMTNMRQFAALLAAGAQQVHT